MFVFLLNTKTTA